MKKKSKFGCNSGGTFHLGHHKSVLKRMHPKQHLIYKFFLNCGRNNVKAPTTAEKFADEAHQQYVNDGGIGHASCYQDSNSAFCHSLNKRKRWLLKENICSAIDDLKNDCDMIGFNEFAITLIERQINPLGREVFRPYGRQSFFRRYVSSLKSSDCIGYHDSRLNMPHVYPAKAKHAYFTGLRAAEKFRKRNNQTKKKKQDFTDEEKTVNYQALVDGDQPEVRYEICEPMMIMPHKHMQRRRPTAATEQTPYQQRRPKKRCKKKHLSSESVARNNDYSIYSKCSDWDDAYSVAGMVEEAMLNEAILASLEVEDSRTSSYMSSSASVVSTEQLITTRSYKNSQRQSKQRKLVKKKKIRSDRCDVTDVKHHIVHVPQGGSKSQDKTDKLGNDGFELGSKTSNENSDHGKFHSEETVDIAFIVEVHTSDISPEVLNAKYNEAYLEGQSLPRSFVIKLSQLANVSSQHNNCDTWTVFECLKTVSESDSNNNNISSVKVSLKMEKFVNLLPETVFSQGSPVHFDEIIVHLSSLTSLLPLKTQCDNKRQHIVKLPWLSLLNATCNWPCSQAYSESDAHHVLQQTHQLKQEDVINKSSEAVEYFAPTLMDYCEICVLPLISPDGNKLNCMAMKHCNHWFCCQCFKHHVSSQITGNSMNIQCPAWGCKVLVDKVTMLRLLPLHVVTKYEHQVNSAKLESSPVWRWCPNARCGRALNIDDAFLLTKGTLSVQCACGDTWCWQCQDIAHWPLSCKATQLYRKTLKARGHFSRTPDQKIHFVLTKPCPSCQYPIYKNGGCSYMHCSMCQTSFCWNCLRTYDNHSGNSCSPNATNFTTYVLEDEVKYLSRDMYKLAVKHRLIVQKWNARKSIAKVVAYALSCQDKLNHSEHESIILDNVADDATPWIKKILKHLVANGLENPVFEDHKTEVIRLTAIAVFVIQLHNTLEYVYAFLSTRYVKKSSTKSIKTSCSELEGVISWMEELLYNASEKGSNLAHLSYLASRAQMHLKKIVKACRSLVHHTDDSKFSADMFTAH